MKLFHFLRRESRTPIRRLAVMAVVSGLASVLILAVINVGVRQAVEDARSFTHLLMFLLATGIYMISQSYLMVAVTSEIEKILHRLRVRIADKIRSCDLEPLETIGRSQIYGCLSRETQTISQATIMLVTGLQAGVLLFFAVFYLAWLSVTAFITFAVLAALAATIQLRKNARLGQGILKAMERENELLDSLTHVLDGFADRLYGLEDSDEERVAALLGEMDLVHKISCHGGEFSTLDLSAGQKKRLAYVVSLLEDRPIYVFDEWAAGQDPEFRKKFYDRLLPQLKQRGKTVFAVTHDDRYWSVADRVLKMEEGRFVDHRRTSP